jgi:hypothetical protein
MDPLNEASLYAILAPQLMSVKILQICAGILLILALLTLLIGWLCHLYWRVRLLALLPLAAGIAAEIVAHVLHDTYVYWVEFLNYWLPVSYPKGFQDHFLREIANADQAATVLGWTGVIVTGVLLALGLVGMWRLVMSGRWRQRSSAIAIES